MQPPFRKSPLALAVGAALASGPVAAFPVVPLTDEFELAADTANTNQQTPDVAMADDGRFVAVWADGGEIFAQRYAADGSATGAEIAVPRADPAATGARGGVTVAMDDDGDFAVAWDVYYGFTGPTSYSEEVIFQRYNADGTENGSPVFANDDVAAGDQVNPDIALDGDGDIVVTWQGYYDSVDTDSITYRLFDASSGALTSSQQAPSNTAGTTVQPSVASSGFGQFVIGWRYVGTNEIQARRFAANGSPLAATLQVAAGSSGPLGNPDVAVDDDGDFAVAWDDYASGLYEVAYRVFDSQGIELLGRTVVAEGGIQPAIALLEPNQTAIAWRSDPSADADGDGDIDGDGDGGGILLSTRDAGGSVDSGPLLVNQTTAGEQDQPAIAMDADGDLVVGFESYVGSTEDDVRGRVFERPSQTVEGTSSGTGALGWLGGLALGLAGIGRRLARRRGGRGPVAFLAGALALGLAGGAPSAQAQGPGPTPEASPREVGHAEEVSGTVTAGRPGGSTRALQENGPIYVGDLVRTGEEAAAVLRLADGSRIALRADSTFRVARLERTTDEDGDSSLTGMFMDLVRGGLRAITGGIAEREPERYQLRTPVATIGVRGTEFDARLCPRGQCPDTGDAATGDAGPDAAARVVELSGVVEARTGNGGTRVLTEGARVFQGDTVRTAGDAWAALRFADGSKVSLEPGTAFVVREWEYEAEEPEQGNALLRLVRGGMRVLTGLIGSEQPESYQVGTPVATIGVRGTGFDLLCQGACVDPDASTAAVQGDGLFVRAWDGEIFAELEGRTAGFAAGETGFLANDSAPVLRLDALPPSLRDLVSPRPDTVTGAPPSSADRLYTYTHEGAITVLGRTGPAAVFEAGEAGVVGGGDSGGAQAPEALPEPPGDFVGPDDTGIAVPTIMGALGSLALGQFELGTAYVGGTAGAGIAGSESDFERRLQRSNPGVSVNDLSGGAGLRAFVGYRLLGVLGVEVGGFDMGDTDSEIDPGTADAEVVARDALDKHPITPRGFDISAIARTPIDATGTAWAFARTGIARWEGKVTTSTPSGERFSKEFSGTDALVGGGVEYRISPNVHARTEWIHYRIDPDPVNYVGAGLVWTFP
ncbi:FecR domain-containing protein [Halofilum ochraceum]|uniref:FecR domain-containing protein n=1 Tax=Halofilum ochraceum TaxID=1611323 RepID=UPI00082F4F07|nr:FecR domain-containing protein [Halofilum ochraceum]